MGIAKFIIRYCWVILILVLDINTGQTQNRFNGAVILGLNASQIDGDNWAGYDKLGLTGGVKLDYKLEKTWYMSMELLYSARGSQSQLVSDASLPLRKVSLQYIEVPLMIHFKDWWIEEAEYFKVDAEAGLSYGYLFNSSSSQGGFTWDTNDFSKNDISVTVGARYFISKRWGFGIRYTRSLTRLYINPDTEERDLLGYFLSFRSIFQF